MTGFDQRNQNVTYQYNYNAAGNINFGSVENCVDLAGELEKLKAEISKARDSNVIDAEIATGVQYQIQKAIDQLQKSEPNKNSILNYLSKAKGFVKGIVDTGGIVTGIMKATELVQNLL